MKKDHENMLISTANAQEVPVPVTTAETAVADGTATIPQPNTTSILIQNVGMIILLVIMFYFLLIRPQQKRFKEHKEMIDALKVGDKVVAAGGLIGTIDKLVNDDEVIVDLGNGTKVSVVRSMIQVKSDKTAATAAKK